MKKRHLSFILLMLLFCSLNTSAQLSPKQFVSKQKNKTTRDLILLVPPTQITHLNSNIGAISNFEHLDPDIQDSLIETYTSILNKINDSILLSHFLKDLTFFFEQKGLAVEINNKPPATLSTNQHLLYINQFEIEETTDYVSFGDNDDRAYNLDQGFKTCDLRIVFTFKGADSLFEASFESHYTAQDELNDVSVEKDSAQKGTKIAYSINPITVNNIYRLSHQIAKEAAYDLTHFLLNQYVYSPKKGLLYRINPSSLEIEKSSRVLRYLRLLEQKRGQIPSQKYSSLPETENSQIQVESYLNFFLYFDDLAFLLLDIFN